MLIRFIKGFELTFFSETKVKWLFITTKNMKQQAHVSFYDILKYCTISIPVNNSSGKISKRSYDTYMVCYISML